MAVAFVRNHASSNLKAAGTTLTNTLAFAVPIGNVLVAAVVFDNAATASKPIVSSISKGAGETANWTLLGASRSTSTTAGAFASAELWFIKTTVAWATSTVLTVTFDTSTVMKAINFTEFSGVDAVQRSTAGSAYSTTTTAASATTTGTAPVIGDLAIGLIFQSNAATGANGDTDTTGGAWVLTSGVGSTGSSAATNNFGSVLYKVLTAASAQTLNNSAVLTAGNGSIVGVLQAAPLATITQASYRFYDDGTESASVARAAQDTATAADLTNGDGEGLVRVRLQSTNTGDQSGGDDYQLQYEKNASGTWINVPDATIAAWNSASLTEGAVTTNRLGAGTGSFVAGEVSEVGLVTDLYVSPNNYTELLYSVLFKAAPFVSGDTVRFRVVRNGSTAGITYTQVPTVNITRTLPAVTQSSYRFYADGTEAGSVALAAQDTAYNASISGGDTSLLLRARLQSINAAPIPVTDDWQLQFGKNLSGTYILEPGTTGNNVDTPHRSGFNVATQQSIVVIAYIAADDWTPTNEQAFASIWGAGAADGMFRVTIGAAGIMRMSASCVGVGGTAATTTILQTASAVADGAGMWVWYMWEADDGTTDFKYSLDPKETALSSIVWTSLQTNRASSTSGILTTSAAPLRIGGYDTNGSLMPFAGKVYRVWVGTGAATGIFSYAAATEIADFNPDKGVGGPTIISGAANDVWTINGTASAVQPGWKNVGIPTQTLLDTYASSNVDSGFSMGNGASLSAMAQSFLGDGKKLSQVGFWLNTQGTPTGTLTARLYAHFDVFGSGASTPTGPALATSTARAATVVGAVGAWVYFQFDNTFTLVSGTPYFISIEYSLFNDGVNFIQAGYDNTASTHAGAMAQLAFGSWTSLTADAAFEVYTVPSQEVLPFNSVNLTDGQATTNRLGAGTGSFAAGKVAEVGLVLDLGWAGNNYTEVLYAMTLASAVLTNGDALTFRVLRNGVSINVPQVPTLSLASGPLTREATIATTFALTATATAVPTHEAGISTAFAFTTTATAVPLHPATVATTFTFTTTAAATVTTPVIVSATIATTFGFTTTASAITTLPATASGVYTFTATATADQTHPATIATQFTFAAAATATVFSPIQATIATTFPFAASATATVTPSVPASITTQFDFLTTATASTTRSATISTAFTFTTTATAVAVHPATIATAFTFTAAATAVITRPATITTAFVWTATAAALVSPPVPATITTAFAFTTTATATVVRPATIATAFDFTTTATALPTHPAVIATQFAFTATATATGFGAGQAVISTVFTFTATAAAATQRSAAIATQFTFVTTATATPSRPATITTQFTFTAISTALLSHPATVATQFTFDATASAITIRPASIVTQFTFTATATALPTVESAITTEFHFSTDSVATPIHPAIITTEFTFTAVAQAELSHEALAIGTYTFTATAAAAAIGVAIVLNKATAIFIGNARASAVYVGAVRAWPV